jgi:hypothetical protein
VCIIDLYVDALTCRRGAAIPHRFTDSVHVGRLVRHPERG